MALQANVTLNYSAYQVGQTPPPMATVTVYNPNASAVNVNSINITTPSGPSTASGSVPPTGPGMTTLVPALSSITIGPFPIVVNSAANSNQFQMVNQTGNLNPLNPQGSQPSQSFVVVGATVYGSDGSVNTAGVATLFVSYATPPPVGYQGGFFNFSAPNNLVLGLLSGAL